MWLVNKNEDCPDRWLEEYSILTKTKTKLKSVGWARWLNSEHTLQWKDLHGDELNSSQLFGTVLLCPKDSAGFQGDESAAFQSRICGFDNNNG